MIQKISIENYKSIKTLSDFELKPVNILIGANNSGKSNFLDVFAFLRDSFPKYVLEDDSGHEWRGWQAAVIKRGGAESVVHYGAQQFKIDLIIQALHYSIEIEATNWKPGRIRHEKLLFDESKQIIFELDLEKNGVSFYKNGQWRNTSYSPRDGYTGLSSLLDDPNRDYENQVYDFARKVSEIKIYDRIHTEIWSPVRTPKVPKGETNLDEDGGNLVGVLHQLSQTQPQFLERLNSLLKVVFDDFAQISFPSNNQGELLIRWEDKNGRVSNVAQLSDGTLKFLCLVAILKNPNPPALIGIDEPDAKLNPMMIGFLSDMIKEAVQRTQIIATTHNPDFVSLFDPDEIVILQQYRGATEMRRFSTKGALELWLEDFDTRELWLMGELESRW